MTSDGTVSGRGRRGVCLVYLNWPERCFRATEGDLRFLKTLVPRGMRVRAVGTDAAFLKLLPEATHVVTWHFRREWYARAPKLRALATPAAGRELVSTDAPDGVTVHFGHFHGRIISESVLAFVLAWTHGFFQVRARALWPRTNLADRVDRDLSGTRAVLLGYGRIGRAIGERLSAFGVDVTGVTRHGIFRRGAAVPASARTGRSFASLLAGADWLIVALPSDTGTDGLVDARMLSALPPRCVLVNVGRGNCIDETALLDALVSGRLAGAYLDVFRNEPTVLAKRSAKPKRGEADLANLPASKCPWNLVRMPHASAYSPTYVRSAFQELKDDGIV